MSQTTEKEMFPWYDGYWMARFVKARRHIAATKPAVLSEFLEAFEPLRTDPKFEARLLENALDTGTLSRIREAIAKLKPGQLELHEIKRFGRWVVHDHEILSDIQDQMTAVAQDVAGEPLESSYNFLSLYTRMGTLPPHLDAPWAKWTFDVCIDQSEPWPIYFSRVRPWPESFDSISEDWEDRVRSDPENAFQSYVLKPGNGVVFSGSSQWHYRDPIASHQSNGFCNLVFFHFIPRGMRALLDAASWESRFGVPGLAEAMGNPAAEIVGRAAKRRA